jgi:hypothetical protein
MIICMFSIMLIIVIYMEFSFKDKEITDTKKNN